MKFVVDREAKEALMQLCDIALRQGGLNTMESIQKVLSSIEDAKEEKTK